MSRLVKLLALLVLAWQFGSGLDAADRGKIRCTEDNDRLSFSRGDSPHIQLKTHSGTAEIRR
ncbi:MAG TPA: hypothetical protein ENN40_06040 [Candidatus Aminicenantes bacterium]|nr:hypothetical protein [Candidatus Aminicenantes bacterium]